MGFKLHEVEEKYYADGEDAFAMKKAIQGANAIKLDDKKGKKEESKPKQSSSTTQSTTQPSTTQSTTQPSTTQSTTAQTKHQ